MKGVSVETHTTTLFTSIFALYFCFKVCSNETFLISMCVGGKQKGTVFDVCVPHPALLYLVQTVLWCLCMHFDQLLVALKCSLFWLNCTWWHRKFTSSCFYSAFATDLWAHWLSAVQLCYLENKSHFFVVISFYRSVLYCMKLPFLNSVLLLCPLITVLTQWLEWSWIWKLG